MKENDKFVTDLITIAKLMLPNNGAVDVKGFAEVFKLGMEAARSAARIIGGDRGGQIAFSRVVHTILQFQRTLEWVY